MKPHLKDTNRTTAKQVSKVTKTTIPKGEDLLGSEELRKALSAAKKGNRR
ncbi:MAG: hypothetical protein JNN17_06050 [Verrucomicrobiaceae bacterium]|nr:hypothetical protein [Verrucomicrobiaceae bacterium]